MIYLDNAATTFPKPDEVHDAMARFLRDTGASPGRSGHRLANAAERTRFDAREAVAELLNVSDPMRVVFTLNATEAINLVMRGMLAPGAHAVTTAMEHNSVMRPLRAMQREGVELSVVPCHKDGTMDIGQLESCVRPDTRLIVVNHASNVCGTVLPVGEIAAVARQRGVPLLVDAAQTAGAWPIDITGDGIDLLAFSGHKGMLGPPGTGGLALSDGFDTARLAPLIRGGTGSASEHEEHPDVLPDKYEAGTPNGVGLAGLCAGVRFVLKRGVAAIREHERARAARLIGGLRSIRGVHLLGVDDTDRRTSTVSFVVDSLTPSEIAETLDERFGVLSRAGLQCAPQAHRTLGTFPTGSVRLSPGWLTSQADVDAAVEAVRTITGER